MFSSLLLLGLRGIIVSLMNLHAPERRDPQNVLVVFDREEVRDWLISFDVQPTPYLIYCFYSVKHSSAPNSKHLS